MTHAHPPRLRILGLTGLLALVALAFSPLSGSRAQPPSPPAEPIPPAPPAVAQPQFRGQPPGVAEGTPNQPPPPAGPPFADIPELTTAPEGTFNRVRAEMLEARERFVALQRQVDEQAQQLEQLRRQGPSGRVGLHGLPEVRDALGEMHRAVDALVQEAERTRGFVQTEVVRNLPTLLAEVQAERQAMPPDDPRQERFARLEQGLQAWAENPDTLIQLFDPEAHPRWRGWDGPRRPNPEDESEPLLPGRRLIRRLERLEAMQSHLSEQLDMLSAEIARMRTALDSASPEQIQALEEGMDERSHWQRGWRD